MLRRAISLSSRPGDDHIVIAGVDVAASGETQRSEAALAMLIAYGRTSTG